MVNPSFEIVSLSSEFNQISLNHYPWEVSCVCVCVCGGGGVGLLPNKCYWCVDALLREQI